MNADEYRKAFPRSHRLEVAPGVFFRVRRVSNVGLLSRGLMPSFYLSEVGANWRRAKGAAEPQPEAVNQTEMMRLILAVVCEAAIEPRLVEGEAGEGELNVFDDVEDAHIMAIFHWAMSGGRGVPVPTTGGEVAVDDLVSFHPPGAGSAANAARADGADVLSAPVADARTAG